MMTLSEPVQGSNANNANNWRIREPLGLMPILSESLRLFTEQGYHATTVREIAKAAGLTVPTMYYHFENKQAVLVALLDRGLGIAKSMIDAALAEADEQLSSRLSAIVRALVLYGAHYSEIAFLSAETRALTPENRDWYVAERDSIQQTLSDVFARGVESGEFDVAEPTESVRAILAMCQSVSSWYRSDGPVAAEEIAERYVRIARAVAGC